MASDLCAYSSPFKGRAFCATDQIKKHAFKRCIARNTTLVMFVIERLNKGVA